MLLLFDKTCEGYYWLGLRLIFCNCLTLPDGYSSIDAYLHPSKFFNYEEQAINFGN